MWKILLRCLAASPLVLFADPYLTPQEAVKKMTVPAGFSVDLLAAEPDIVQPIAFCWDARGRIWVLEGNTYPQRAGQPVAGDSTKPTDAQLKDILGGKDRILIFEDADHNGTYESRKVFIEGLNLASGIEIGFGGVYVGAAPYLLHIPVKEGDDKPSGPPEILLDGWGWQDTHETLNSFNWGPDGWLYGCHGVFTQSAVGKPGTAKEDRTKLNCAYWRFHPVTKKFDIYAHGTSNSWGFDYNASGDWFSEACVIPHFWHIIQGAYYLRQSNPLGHFNPYVYTNIETIADHLHYVGNNPHGGNGVSDTAGGGHAHCGLCIYQGDNFPAEYQGRAMMFNIHGQRINQETLVPEGSGYVAKATPDFLKANDVNFTGVSLKVGPDGAVYFIDWYDKLKCHRPTPEEWDRSNGRMYRVKFDATWKPYAGEDLTKADDARLDALADHSNVWQRRVSRRLAMEKNFSATRSQWNEEQAKGINETTGNPVTRLEKLWRYICNGGTTNPGLMEADTTAPDFRIWMNSLMPTSTLKTMLESARTRLGQASHLTTLPVEKRWGGIQQLIGYSEDAKDHNLPQMIWYAIEPCVAKDPAKALELAAKSKIPLVTQNIARRLSEMDGGLQFLFTAVSQLEDANLMKVYLKAAVEGLTGKVGIAAPAAWEKAYSTIEGAISKQPELGNLRLSLAVSFGDVRVYPQLRSQVFDKSLTTENRRTALQALVAGNDPELPNLVVKLLDDTALRLDALKALPQTMSKLK